MATLIAYCGSTGPLTGRDRALLRNVPPYTVRVSRELSDPDWDRFVEATDGGTYQQSSMWAQVKSTVGWRPIRFALSRDGKSLRGVKLWCGLLLGSVR
jgi:hypothetical protein